jgi:lysozyme
LRLAALAFLLSAGAAALLYALYEQGSVRFNHPSRSEFPVWGLDVSHHQGEIDWRAVARAGIEFAFIKASEGRDHRDREFARNWSGAREAGVARGAYHFFTFCTDGRAQAENFLDALAGSIGELPPVVDVEFSGNCKQWESIERIRGELRAFLEHVEQAVPRSPILYFPRDAYARILYGHFDDRPAWPRNVWTRPSDGADSRWLFWQFADNGRISGVSTLVDLNVFRGTRAEFEALIAAPAQR